MLFYTIRRIAYAVPIAFAVSIVCFLLVHLAPGDPINALLPPDATPDIVAQVRADYGLDKPLPVQYLLWAEHVLHGDLGRSILTRRPVLLDLQTAIGKTFLLAACAAILGFALACLLGGLAGTFRGSWIDKVATSIAVAGVSVPHYWMGMVTVIIFSVLLNALPAMGAGPGNWAWDWEHIRFLLLPVITLAVGPTGIITRTIRGTVSEILSQDFVTTLRGKGLGRLRVLLHVVKNTAPTALAVMGLQLGYLMGGSILVETVFSWPGTGSMLNTAIFQRDIPVVQGSTLVLSMFFVFLNLLVDLVQTALDPRMRRS